MASARARTHKTLKIKYNWLFMRLDSPKRDLYIQISYGLYFPFALDTFMGCVCVCVYLHLAAAMEPTQFHLFVFVSFCSIEIRLYLFNFYDQIVSRSFLSISNVICFWYFVFIVLISIPSIHMNLEFTFCGMLVSETEAICLRSIWTIVLYFTK